MYDDEGFATMDYAAVSNGWKYTDVSFNDRSAYRFHSSWIKDVLPTNIGPETHRLSVSAVGTSQKPTQLPFPSNLLPTPFMSLSVTMMKRSKSRLSKSSWLKTWAPFVGKPLNADSPTKRMSAETSALFQSLMPHRKGWTADSLMFLNFMLNVFLLVIFGQEPII